MAGRKWKGRQAEVADSPLAWAPLAKVGKAPPSPVVSQAKEEVPSRGATGAAVQKAVQRRKGTSHRKSQRDKRRQALRSRETSLSLVYKF